MEKYIKTNMGVMPLEDYLDIQAAQAGFEDYKDLKANGYSIDTSNLSIIQVEKSKFP